MFYSSVENGIFFDLLRLPPLPLGLLSSFLVLNLALFFILFHSYTQKTIHILKKITDSGGYIKHKEGNVLQG